MTIRGHLARCGLVWGIYFGRGQIRCVSAQLPVRLRLDHMRRLQRRSRSRGFSGRTPGRDGNGVSLSHASYESGALHGRRSTQGCMSVMYSIHLSMSYRDGQVSRSDPSTGSFPVGVLYSALGRLEELAMKSTRRWCIGRWRHTGRSGSQEKHAQIDSRSQ